MQIDIKKKTQQKSLWIVKINIDNLSAKMIIIHGPYRSHVNHSFRPWNESTFILLDGCKYLNEDDDHFVFRQ